MKKKNQTCFLIQLLLRRPSSRSLSVCVSVFPYVCPSKVSSYMCCIGKGEGSELWIDAGSKLCTLPETILLLCLWPARKRGNVLAYFRYAAYWCFLLGPFSAKIYKQVIPSLKKYIFRQFIIMLQFLLVLNWILVNC